jgi:hypothetical protein
LVERDGARLAMDFPALPDQPCPAPAVLLAGLKQPTIEVLAADLAELSRLDRRVRHRPPAGPWIS